MANNIAIGIAGGTGSGKTTLVKKLEKYFGEDVCTLCHDYYYREHGEVPLLEREKLNYDHPDAFETDRLVDDIKSIKMGRDILRPVYSFLEHNRTDNWIKVKAKRVLIVEGILVFEHKELYSEFDIKVFVDTDCDIRLIRRIIRDVKTRGRTLDSVINQYLTTVKPMHDEFVEPSKRIADIIIPEGGHNEVALQMLIHRIKSILESK